MGMGMGVRDVSVDQSSAARMPVPDPAHLEEVVVVVGWAACSGGRIRPQGGASQRYDRVGHAGPGRARPGHEHPLSRPHLSAIVGMDCVLC